MIRWSLFLFFTLLSIVAFSQSVTIKGSAQNYANKEIGLWVFNDYISKTEKQLTYSDIDSAGNFLLEFNSREIQYITLKIENNIASMFV